MSEVQITSDIEVSLIKTDMDDRIPVLAARTSTLGAESTAEERKGLINALIRDGHHVPFEHMGLTIRITAPIFVWRQFVKHRIGVSLSEESGRYRELKPIFYTPSPDRPLFQTGKPMDYQFSNDMDPQKFLAAEDAMVATAEIAWKNYQFMLSQGITREVARMCLPVSIMSTGIVTMNCRALMHFLTLRTSGHGSHPQYECELVAEELEELFAGFAPITHEAFRRNQGERTE